MNVKKVCPKSVSKKWVPKRQHPNSSQYGWVINMGVDLRGGGGMGDISPPPNILGGVGGGLYYHPPIFHG